MANAVIFEKGSDTVTFFIKNARQIGRDFVGSNDLAIGVKEALFDVKWTEDNVEPVFDETGKRQTGWDKKVSDIVDAKTYKGVVISTESDIDAVTRSQIAQKYSLTDEIKLLRQKIMGILSQKEWDDYITYTQGLVEDGRAMKDVVIAEKSELEAKP